MLVTCLANFGWMLAEASLDRHAESGRDRFTVYSSGLRTDTDHNKHRPKGACLREVSSPSFGVCIALFLWIVRHLPIEFQDFPSMSQLQTSVPGRHGDFSPRFSDLEVSWSQFCWWLSDVVHFPQRKSTTGESIYLSTYLPIYLSTYHLSTYLSVCLSVYLSIYIY